MKFRLVRREGMSCYMSVLQCRNRHHKHAIRPLICCIGHTAQDTEYRGRFTLGILFDLFLISSKLLAAASIWLAPSLISKAHHVPSGSSMTASISWFL